MAIPKIAAYPLPEPCAWDGKVDWRFVPERAVLLIHDMQRYFVDFFGEDSAFARTLIANIAALRERCEALGIPVVYTAQPCEQPAADRALLNDMWGPGLTTADPALQAVVPQLAPRERDTVLVKWRYSAFQRSDLAERMKGWGRDQLIVCGVYAHIGCMATALEAFMRDIQPFFVADALGDFSEREHRMALDYVAGRCGRVVFVRDIAPVAPLTRDEFLARMQEVLDDDIGDVGPEDNLLDFGLDSVAVLRLVAEWQARGIAVEFADLARHETLEGWWQVLEERQGPRVPEIVPEIADA